MSKVRAEIIVSGLVQGVGFRYFIMRNAEALGLTGYSKNLFTGEVMAVVEGEKEVVQELYSRIKQGPSHSSVDKVKITWSENKNEFSNFTIRH